MEAFTPTETVGAGRRVVTTVHGTWAKYAPWIEPDSALGRALTQRFGPGLVVAPFRWSGRNNPSARDKAKDELRAHLRHLQEQYQQAQHFIVAHSHGGNVAFYALRDDSLRNAISGVVCLATPFLVARPRVLAGKGIISHLAGAVGVLLLVVQLLTRWLLPTFEPAWLRELAGLALLLLSMGLIVTLLKEWRSFGERLSDVLRLKVLPQDRVLIVRAPGDEASAALLFFQFVSQLSVRLYVRLHQLHARLHDLLERWSAHRLGPAAALVGGIVLYSAVIILAIALDLPTGATVTLLFLLVWLCVWVPLLMLIGWTEVAAFPLQFVVGVLFFAIIIVLSVTLLPFGWQVALGNILLDVTAETTPQGAWVVHQIEPTTRQDQARHAHPLQHSVVYEDPRSLNLICDWIEQSGARLPRAEVAGRNETLPTSPQ